VQNIDSRLVKYGQIEGTYNVYDSLGNYLYVLNLTHTDSLTSKGHYIDSLPFDGFDGQFYFSKLQSSTHWIPDYSISISYKESLYDTFNNRWKIIFSHDLEGIYDNTYHNDTIKFIYRKVNINYYLQDLTPYLDTTIKIIAVKNK
jgi:hypothetical protein